MICLEPTDREQEIITELCQRFELTVEQLFTTMLREYQLTHAKPGVPTLRKKVDFILLDKDK